MEWMAVGVLGHVFIFGLSAYHLGMKEGEARSTQQRVCPNL